MFRCKFGGFYPVEPYFSTSRDIPLKGLNHFFSKACVNYNQDFMFLAPSRISKGNA